MSQPVDFTVPTLGRRGIRSPISLSTETGDSMANYVNDEDRILHDIVLATPQDRAGRGKKSILERAGPREMIYFEPAKVMAGIVSAGGLCPGINDVIRSIVMCLWYRYGVRRICGIRFGFRGLLPEFGLSTAELNPTCVQDIHRRGGTILGSARGFGPRTPELVDSIERMNMNILFAVGGDGTQRGALAIAEEAEKRRYRLAVVGIPKTIDNDISFIDKSFGFETAVARACDAVSAAHVEAHDALNGIGLVKVMGRNSGFIAAHTALAINDVNYVLIPEVPFSLGGDNGLLHHLETRLEARNHAVILVAEGAGQELMNVTGEKDASGNLKLGDIGLYLTREIKSRFKKKGREINLKYIDPSYMIRSAPANPADSLYCTRLGNNAVHAAMAGGTKIIISLVNNHFVHVPIAMAISRKNRVDPESSVWRDVVEATGQPPVMNG